ncbi:hypothetical protein [Mycoplasmopsis anatis]|uniref:hypothetical protein n=1 Tax=Mycoplasmopsis anatis TaxID=171279 RepID=UPI001C4F98A0|nr:hypothetical protein [Mycoplasmopsis anatis]MBW0596675.1 hypothetical protein [Mycoplasmopsis anatis]
MSTLKDNLNYKDNTLEPIKNIYEKNLSLINEILKIYFKQHDSENTEYRNEVANLTESCIQISRDIKQRKKKDKIIWRKFINFLIFISFILIFGLFFLKFYKENKKIISDFNAFKLENTKIINNQKSRIIWLKTGYFSNVDKKTIAEYVMKNLGFKIEYSFDYNLLNELFANTEKNTFPEQVVAVNSLLKIRYKNTPIYKVSLSDLYFKIVTTSNSESFPYTKVVNGKIVTSFETLTAYHRENTPFIDNKDYMILKTNFSPQLSFDNSGIINNYKFENKEFNKIIQPNLKSNEKESEVNLLQFFTIKAQEDYVNWYKYLNNTKPIFSKSGNFWIVKSNVVNYSSLLKNEELDSFRFEESLDNKIELVEKRVTSYIKNVLQDLTTLLIPPAISRELYDYSGNYKTSTTNELENNNETLKFDNTHLLTVLNNDKYFTFSKNNPSLNTWLTIENTRMYDEDGGCAIYSLKYNSFYHKDLIDNVVVVGRHVGPQVIPVKYRRFYEMCEPKTVFFIRNTSTIFLHEFSIFLTQQEIKYSTEAIAKIEADSYNGIKYSDDDEIWSLMRLWFGKNIFNNKLNDKENKILSIIKQMCEILPDDFSIHCNQAGISICINQQEWMDRINIINELIKLSKELFIIQK